MSAMRASVVVAVAGAVVIAASFLFARQTVALSYLVAYTGTVAVVVGTLLTVLIAHLSGAVWFVILRRQAEAVIASLPALAAFAIPLIVAPRAFWPWAGQSTLWYLNPGFFAIRTVAYWAVWIWAGERLLRMTRRQDHGGEGMKPRQVRVLSAAAVPFVTLALTFAAFDWMMSLSPAWSSSLYGAYYSAGGLLAALALIAVLARRMQSHRGEAAPTAEHFHALARLMLAFVLLWGYFWYSQFFIIWIADIPGEAMWYVPRLTGGWRVLERFVLVCGFVLPFLVLVFREARRSGAIVAALGLLLLAVHYLDVFWLVGPEPRVRWSFAAVLFALGPLALVGGGSAALAIWRTRGLPPVPIGDPLLSRSREYRTR